jgi:hypothetical protein
MIFSRLLPAALLMVGIAAPAIAGPARPAQLEHSSDWVKLELVRQRNYLTHGPQVPGQPPQMNYRGKAAVLQDILERSRRGIPVSPIEIDYVLSHP